jgi:hypothetical protein
MPVRTAIVGQLNQTQKTYNTYANRNDRAGEEKLLSAMRQKFGGHIEQSAG